MGPSIYYVRKEDEYLTFAILRPSAYAGGSRQNVCMQMKSLIIMVYTSYKSPLIAFYHIFKRLCAIILC